MQKGFDLSAAAPSLQFQHQTDDLLWDAWLAAQPNGHVLQLSGWRKLKERFGWRGGAVLGSVAPTAAESAPLPANVPYSGESRPASGPTGGPVGSAIVSGCQLLFKRAARLTLAYAPRGPITDWSNRYASERLLQEIHHYARSRGAAVLKIEPHLPDSFANRDLLRSYGFTPSSQTVQPPSSIVLDLRGGEDAILARMKSKWRYNVRLAERKGVSVRPLRRDELGVFNSLMQITGERDGFGVHSPDYFAAAYDLLTPQHAAFLLAEYEGQPLAAIVVAAVGGTACYLWGASSDRERNRMPNHALQWEGMRWALGHGALRYDFWGIPDAVGQLAAAMRGGDGSGTPSEDLPIDLEALPQGELWGVYRFKQGFGGQVVRAVGAWDMALDMIGYRVYQAGLGAQAGLDRIDKIRRIDKIWSPPFGLRAPFGRNDAAGAPACGAAEGMAGAAAVAGVADDAASSVQAREVDTAEEWRALLERLPAAHVLQSWEWGEVKAQTGWHARRYALAGDAAEGAFQLLWRQPIAGVPLRLGYVPKGPLLAWEDLDLADAALEAVEQAARALGCVSVKIDPDVREDTSTGRLLLHALERRGWQYSAEQVQFKNTAFSDLSAGEEALLEGMKQKWRYNVRLAQKRGVRVREAGESDFEAFYALYGETGARDGFIIRPYEYYATTWRTFLRAQAQEGNPAGGVLLLAEHPEEAQPLAGLFLFRYGARAWYFYGASSERHRRDMPNYLLQWEALRWALGQGCTVYDWWGAPTHPEDEQDPMQGVWQFKQGFGAELQPHIGAWDFPLMPPLYRLYQEAMPAVLDWMRSHHH